MYATGLWSIASVLFRGGISFYLMKGFVANNLSKDNLDRIVLSSNRTY